MPALWADVGSVRELLAARPPNRGRRALFCLYHFPYGTFSVLRPDVLLSSLSATAGVLAVLSRDCGAMYAKFSFHSVASVGFAGLSCELVAPSVPYGDLLRISVNNFLLSNPM